MAIEDTFGYRFVRMSLMLLNCLVLIRLISLLLQYSHIFDPTFVLFILLIGSNFMAAIIGSFREHRITVLITGSLTLIMFLSLLFTNKENKNLNVSLFTLLAIAAQSLIFSEMLKERQIFAQRQNLDLWSAATTSSSRRQHTSTTTNGPLTAVVVYQPPGSTNRSQTGGIFMVDPILGTELPKDPPPSYFAASCPPPKYEDAIKLNASNIVLPQLVQQQAAAPNAVTSPEEVLPTNSSTTATTTTTTSSSSSSSSPSIPEDNTNTNNNETNVTTSSNNTTNNNNQIRTTETISAAVAAAAAIAQQQQKEDNDPKQEQKVD
ncbi:hypothetical protein DERF_012895 [Dermatophagoides farinae]|uniref:Uncharacterized protein n=1 Tax=Dermatophagoides farinae TaxID=6954 RepID=A0A922HT41_DERFA|nr:putative uncharacterized protein DDB_G0271982 [Dermatophagoides farinae]KAH7640229.1 hypothetical protein HUG17_7696 [Dermatophagoides farinae]KAH9502101.1 hypothetical protein DERF_012895 [Dermatophagoides farinae]KAH9502102.1 hypothetical protein DERF_012895 [Dermatophagoides farinae]